MGMFIWSAEEGFSEMKISEYVAKLEKDLEYQELLVKYSRKEHKRKKHEAWKEWLEGEIEVCKSFIEKYGDD